MATFSVPTKETVSEANQAIFANLEKGLGFVPNLYATFAHNETALGDFLGASQRKSTLTGKEKEIINLVVSEINGCAYCKAAHTAIGKNNGFNDEQILEIRSGAATFNAKYDALAKFVSSASINRSKPTTEATDALLAAGYDAASVADIALLIGEITVTNYLHGITQIPVDFPAAPELAEAVA